MGAAVVPARAANRVHYAGKGHARSAGSARRCGWQGISPVSAGLAASLGQSEYGTVVGLFAAGLRQGAASHQQSPAAAVSPKTHGAGTTTEHHYWSETTSAAAAEAPRR